VSVRVSKRLWPLLVCVAISKSLGGKFMLGMACEILHMYVDGLWVQKDGCKTPADYEALLAEITEQIGLPISLDGIYK
jgi:hypothetical protein